MSAHGWARRVEGAEGPDRSAAQRVLAQDAVSAAGVRLYGLALVREGLGEARVVAMLGAQGTAATWATTCLDLRTGRGGMDTITITRDGRTVALAGRERFWLAAHIQALPGRHPRRRHVCFMAVYARDILTGDMPGPYTDADADHFAHLVTNAGGCDPGLGARVSA